METEIALIAVVGIVTIVAVAAFSKQLGVAAPHVLGLVGVAASFIPGLTTPIVIPSWVILTVVLPPLLYANAVQVPILDFRRNLGSITTLSVWLVIGTSVAVGFMLNALLPGLGLAAGHQEERKNHREREPKPACARPLYCSSDGPMGRRMRPKATGSAKHAPHKPPPQECTRPRDNRALQVLRRPVVVCLR